MRYLFSALILLGFFAVLGVSSQSATAETKGYKLLPPDFNWGKHHRAYREYKKYNPYLEDARHAQIPQWADEDWYVEDWTSQQSGRNKGMTLVEGFYAADILRDQKAGHAELPVLVVGPNFYRLSGLDKRRVAHTVAVTYGMTEDDKGGAFILEDWHTCMPIGVFDEQGVYEGKVIIFTDNFFSKNKIMF